MKKAEGLKLRRNYSRKTIKVLFALSGNQCAEPSCSAPIIQSQSADSDVLVVGQIAHIYALNVDGPRGRSDLTESELNGVSNLILLCPTHHVVVDGQYESYPANILREWKDRHERQFSGRLTRSIGEIGFAELEIAARALADHTAASGGGSQYCHPLRRFKRMHWVRRLRCFCRWALRSHRRLKRCYFEPLSWMLTSRSG